MDACTTRVVFRAIPAEGFISAQLHSSSPKLNPQATSLRCSLNVQNFSRSQQASKGRGQIFSAMEIRSMRKPGAVALAAVTSEAPTEAAEPIHSKVTVLINGATGKMGQAVARAAADAGLAVAPLALAGPGVPLQYFDCNGSPVEVHGAEDRDDVLDRTLRDFPGVVVVDFTLPAAVNDNAEFYCRKGVPFVMGTTGGDRVKLLQSVKEAGLYAVIAPQMGKQVVAFLAAIEAIADACPGAFTGYTLKVVESHQASKVDTSGTAKEVVGFFQRLGLDFSIDQIEKVRDPEEQKTRMGVPQEYLRGHAFHTYSLTSPDGTVAFQFQHNVCGQSIYAQGTVDAVLFLSQKIAEKAEKRLYTMVDVLRGGAMR